MASTDRELEEIAPGDIVAVQHGIAGHKEGLVVGSYVDLLGRQILKVQLEPTEPIYHAWYPSVTRVRRTISYSRPSSHSVVTRPRTIERRIYW